MQRKIPFRSPGKSGAGSEVNLVLTGFRGAGKSAVGKDLARRLALGHLDTDESLEKASGLSIREMVEKYGWDDFRAREKTLVRELSALDDHVISAGGGVVMDTENIRKLKRNGRILLLTADAEVLLKRLRGDPATHDRRPPLAPRTGGNERDREVREALEKRAPYYFAAADHVIDTTVLSVSEVVAVAAKWWEKTI